MSCQESHSCSGLGRIPGYCPTRLIDIGTTDDGNWKLYEGTDNPPAYLTLSHRWGPFQPLKLERSSLADFRRGMPVSKLPKTFRDAITVARHLSVRYLWIDSLCIIQDSLDDWQNEASRMCGVYANRFCECLCWRVGRDSEGNPVGSKPQQRRAPSWSWASMDGQIDYEEENDMIRFWRWYDEDLRTLATLVHIYTVQQQRVPL